MGGQILKMRSKINSSTPNNPILDTLYDLFLEKKNCFLFWPKNAKKMPPKECKIFFFNFSKL